MNLTGVYQLLLDKVNLCKIKNRLTKSHVQNRIPFKIEHAFNFLKEGRKLA